MLVLQTIEEQLVPALRQDLHERTLEAKYCTSLSKEPDRGLTIAVKPVGPGGENSRRNCNRVFRDIDHLISQAFSGSTRDTHRSIADNLEIELKEKSEELEKMKEKLKKAQEANWTDLKLPEDMVSGIFEKYTL